MSNKEGTLCEVYLSPRIVKAHKLITVIRWSRIDVFNSRHFIWTPSLQHVQLDAMVLVHLVDFSEATAFRYGCGVWCVLLALSILQSVAVRSSSSQFFKHYQEIWNEEIWVKRHTDRRLLALISDADQHSRMPRRRGRGGQLSTNLSVIWPGHLLVVDGFSMAADR